MRKRSIKFIMLCLSVLFMVSMVGCGQKTKKAEKKLKEITINLTQEPGTMDPQLLTDQVAIQANSLLMEGLTRLGKGGKVVPGVAKTWDVEGAKWTLHLRKDSKWSNGEPVTANDFYYGIRRAIEPATASEYAYMTYYIKNAEAYNNGEVKDFSKVGLKVIDDYTLELILEKPAAYFSSVLAFPTYLPVNKEFAEAKGTEFALEADALLYNGPYIMESWEHDSKMVFVKNENYWNKEAIKLDKINALMVVDANTSLNMYKSGELDIVGLNGEQLPPFKNSKELVSYSDGSVWYFEYNTTDKLFKNKKIRKAIALAIDREQLVDKVLKNGSKPGTGLVPFGFPGKEKGFRKDYGEVLYKNNEAEAKKIFAEGLKEVGYTGQVTISMLTGTSDSATKIAQFYQEQLRTKLGVEVKIEQVTFQIRLQRMTAKDFQIVLAGWGPDYNDPMTYMDLWISDGGNNHTSWGNKEYDELIAEAYMSSDNTVRMDAMAKAEQILVEEFPIATTYYRNSNKLVKPRLKGVEFRSVGAEMDFYRAYLAE